MAPKSPRKPPAAPKEMTAQGSSSDWVKGQANQKRIVTKFLKYLADVGAEESALWRLTWEGVPEAELCTQKFWGMFGQYLLETYTIEPGHKNAGNLMDSGSVVSVWGGLIQQAKQIYQRSTEVKTQVLLPFCAHICPAMPLLRARLADV